MKNKNPLRSAIVKLFNFLFIIAFFAVFIYVATFTDIPNKVGNVIRKEIEEFKEPYETYNEKFKINELSISNNMYYFNTLTKEQRYIYEAIANGVKNYDDEFVVRDYVDGDKDDFAREVSYAIEAFTNDHPEVFYLKAQYSSYVYPAFEGNIGYIRLNYTEENTYQNRISNDVKYYKEDDIPRKYHTAEGTLLEGVGVCDSFSKAYQLVLNKVGIDSIIVLGNLNDSPHAWNMVKLGDNWYHVDITSSHSIYDEAGIINHAYFNLTTEAEKAFVTLDNEEILPKCNSGEFNYYNYYNLVIEENSNIEAKMREIYDHFNGLNYIEFYFNGDVSVGITEILTALRDIDESYLDGSKLYYYNIKNAIIIHKN